MFTVRSAKSDEIEPIAELVAGTFSGGNARRYERLVHRWTVRLPQKPGFKLSQHRVGVEDGRIVSYALVERYRLRYGRSQLHVGGVGSLCTHPAHGDYAAAVMRDAVAYMAEQGAHMSLLNSGESAYYEQFGFSSVWPYYYVEIDSATAATLESTSHLRPVRADDIPQLAALYEKHWGGRVTFIRSAPLWRWLATDSSYRLDIVEGSSGQIQGYLLYAAMTDHTVEAVVDGIGAAATVLAHAGRLHTETGRSRIRWLMPPDDAFIIYARQLLTVTVSARYQAGGGWVARLIDTPALVEALLPEITAQAHVEAPDFAEDRLVLDCQPDRVEIGMHGETRSFCTLDHRDFIQIVFGSLRPTALSMRAPISTEAVQLLETLFPPRMAALAPWDWF